MLRMKSSLIPWLSILVSYRTVIGVGRGTFEVHLYEFGVFLVYFWGLLFKLLD
jgi:hypothetical protein